MRQSIEHLRAGAGLYSTLYKAYKIWGDESEKQLLWYLYDDYVYNFKVGLLTGKDKYKAKEIRLWLKQHEEETAIPDFEIESLARCLLPKIQAYFESDEGNAAFEAWKKQRHSDT